jgi:hypothetical protein
MMTEKPLNTVLKDMNLVNKLSRKSGLTSGKLKGSQAAAARLSVYFGITKTQVYLLSVAFFLTMKKMVVDLNDVGNYVEMDEDDLVCLLPDVNVLLEKKFLNYSYRPYDDEESLLNRQIKVSQPLTSCIIANRPLSDMEEECPMDLFKFVREVSSLIDHRSNTESPSFELYEGVKRLEKEHAELDMPAGLINQSVSIQDRILFYKVCDDVAAHSFTALVQTLEQIYDSTRQRLQKTQELLSGSDVLTQLGLIRIKSAQLLSNANLELTDKALELFLGEHISLFFNETDQDYIEPESIVEKELFFDSELSHQLGFLRKSLQNDNYLRLQERLIDKGMRGGIAVILYGEPGTGKTESVYQLAKETGRGIVHVTISETKSMWFGESEKKIKEVFDKYERICKRASIKPILLFNEADAIFGKRKEVGANNLDQTENAIQNIILDEMEKLEGILIATTNLATNLDSAFERRFLFKIKFSKPSLEVNQKIWKSKLDWLDDKATCQLASRFAFSGGEIDNVVRKVAMDEVLYGAKPGMEGLTRFCEAERLSGVGGRRLIGFGNNV